MSWDEVARAVAPARGHAAHRLARRHRRRQHRRRTSSGKSSSRSARWTRSRASPRPAFAWLHGTQWGMSRRHDRALAGGRLPLPVLQHHDPPHRLTSSDLTRVRAGGSVPPGRPDQIFGADALQSVQSSRRSRPCHSRSPSPADDVHPATVQVGGRAGHVVPRLARAVTDPRHRRVGRCTDPPGVEADDHDRCRATGPARSHRPLRPRPPEDRQPARPVPDVLSAPSRPRPGRPGRISSTSSTGFAPAGS